MEYEIVELKQNRVFKGKVIYNINFLDEQIEANKRNIRKEMMKRKNEIIDRIGEYQTVVYNKMVYQEYGKIIHYDYFVGYETENKNENIEKFDYKKEQFEREFLNLNGRFAKFCLFGNPEKIVPKFWKELDKLELNRKYDVEFEECIPADNPNFMKINIYVSLRKLVKENIKMEINMEWKNYENKLEPCITIISNDKNYKNYLDCFLVDYGGFEWNSLNILDQINDLVEIIKEFVEGKRTKVDFIRETFYIFSIDKKIIEIGFNFDNQFYDTVALEDFYKIIVEWKKFLYSIPNQKNKIYFEIKEKN